MIPKNWLMAWSFLPSLQYICFGFDCCVDLDEIFIVMLASFPTAKSVVACRLGDEINRILSA